jgi:hypothetical protein
MKFTSSVRVHAPGHRAAIESVKDALGFIDRHLTPEIARLPRWILAHKLFLEVERTGKSRDMNAAMRQFRQALRNERWLDEEDKVKSASPDRILTRNIFHSNQNNAGPALAAPAKLGRRGTFMRSRRCEGQQELATPRRGEQHERPTGGTGDRF